MKATGIVRRIDDLGRVVIPKEIRRVLRIRDGDPLEIFTDRDGEVIFRKYSPVGEMHKFAQELCETMARVSGHTVAVTDRDAVIACAGPLRKEVMDKKVGQELETLMEERQSRFNKSGDQGIPLSDGNGPKAMAMVPIIVLGDITGCALFFGSSDSDVCTDTEMKLCQTIATFLSKQIES